MIEKSKFSTHPYYIRKCLILFLVLGYIMMINIKHHEILPFFSWSLFSHTPSWGGWSLSLVVAHTIDGKKVDKVLFVDKTSYRARIDKVRNICTKQKHKCNQAVKKQLFPLIKEELKNKNVEFSLYKAWPNLPLLRDDMKSDIKIKKDIKYFHLHTLIGRWHIKE